MSTNSEQSLVGERAKVAVGEMDAQRGKQGEDTGLTPIGDNEIIDEII
jgi:hypothetical protein